ncbi:AAA family ATPase [Pseudomonas chlororaphis]|uniref:AAA family ATPase n=1 Tax=Pseudomonas chlororaphis TaxID=587753 RepID=UPI0013898DFB|nr:AAA family ATPase [Pseudomonas chlororaphis]UVE47893.1 ATP-binding protein [Pseudomonas chlororaphis]
MTWKIKLEDAPDGFGDCIHISPSKPNWNDFGFNYHASGYFLYKGEMVFLSAYVLPLNIKEQKPYSYLVGAPHGELRYFVSLLSNPEQYRHLASKLPSDAFIYLLEELHEVSYDRYVGTGKYEHVIQIEPFRLGVLRDQKAYLSLINGFAGSYVQPPMGDAKIPFIFSTFLPGTENFVSLDISFRHHEHFDDRVHCLIGINGTGKTNLLARLAVEAASLSNRNQDGPPTQLYSEDKKLVQHDSSTLSFTKDFRFNRIVSYFSDPSSTLPRFSSVGAFEYHAFNTTAKKETKEFHQNLSYLLVTLLRVTDDRFNQTKSKIFTEALSGIMPMDLLAIPVSEDCPEYCCVTDSEGKNWSFINQMNGEQRSLDILGTIDTTREPSFLSAGSRRVIDLSSGQRSMFHFALHFLTLAGYGTLLIIDEPETYLHPNLVSDYMMFLYNILERTSSMAIIATHSAYVVREVPTHCVHILERKGVNASISRPYLQTLGANVAEISLAVFGDSTVDAYHRKVSEMLAKTNMSFDQIVGGYKDILNIEMLMEIKDRISNPEEYD